MTFPAYPRASRRWWLWLEDVHFAIVADLCRAGRMSRRLRHG